MSNKKGAGRIPHLFDLYIYFIKLEGVHGQIWRVYFPWRFNDIEEKAGKWGIDKIWGNRDFACGVLSCPGNSAKAEQLAKNG